MAVVTVETENGPVLIDEENIEAWSGKPASEFKIIRSDDEPKPKAKRTKAAAVAAPVVANVHKLDDETFILVDAENNQVGDAVYQTEEAAWEAVLG